MEIYLFLFTDDKYRFYRFHCGGAIIRAAAAAVKCSLVNSRRLRTEHVDRGHRGWWTRLWRLIWACPADGAGARALSSHPNSPLRHICFTWPHPRTAPWCLEAFVALVLQERAESWMNHTTRGQWLWRWGNANLKKKNALGGFPHSIKGLDSTPRPAEEFSLLLNIYSGSSRPCWERFSPHARLQMKTWKT